MEEVEVVDRLKKRTLTSDTLNVLKSGVLFKRCTMRSVYTTVTNVKLDLKRNVND